MKTQPSIEFHLRCPATEALQRIQDATAQESLAFVEPNRRKDREFIAHVNGTKFRIWKWSSRSRGRRNHMIPMLRGEIRDTERGSDLSAVFVLHPFGRIWPPLAVLIFVGIAVTVWFQAHDLEGKLFALFPLLFAGFIGFALFSGRGREREEIQITQFVEKLFGDLRS